MPHHRWLAGYAFLTFVVVLLVLYAGGFTTTIGAGMVFPDWPLSNGSLNPPGWTTDQAMLAEHGHRLMAGVVGVLCIGLVIFVHRVPTQRWVRRASWMALGLVIFQALLGGMRVLLVSIDLAKVHGVVAQIFLCLLTAAAIGTSAWWKAVALPLTETAKQQWQSHRHWGLWLCLLIVLQLVVGAVMRHRGAGLAVPYFPQATADGAWLPTVWNWATHIHMAHRFGAVLIYLTLLVWVFRLLRRSDLPRAATRLAWTALLLVHLQIFLGAQIIWDLRQPIETTLHMLNGAIFLSVCWSITFIFFKPCLESEVASPSGRAASDASASTPGAPLMNETQQRA